MNPHWERFKEQKARAFYESKRQEVLQRDEIKMDTLIEGIERTIRKFNSWLVQGRSINSEHPYTVFVNFLKKECRLTPQAVKCICTGNLRVDYTDTQLTDIHLYDTYWPHWAIPSLDKLRNAARTAVYNTSGSIASKEGTMEARMENIIDTIKQFSF